VVIAQGDIWWADLPAPRRSAPEFRRPVLIVQSDARNRGNIATVICVPLTSNVKWALMPGNVYLSARSTGLSKNSVANVSQIVTIDESLLTERSGKLPNAKLDLVLSGIELVLSRNL
jgi:mRNA interferase MazF